MQRTRKELEQMTPEELVERVLEMQDILRESLLVRNSMQKLINELLTLKSEEVAYYASLTPEDQEQIALKEAWAEARHAVANPSGFINTLRSVN